MAINNINDLGAALNNAASQFNPSDYPIVLCDKCGSNMFVPAVVMRLIPGILVGSKESNIEIPVHKVFRCANCGAMLSSDRQMLEELDKKKEENNKINKTSSSGLIL